MQKLQVEYQCKTASEKALCESAALNYVRTLEVQHHLSSYINKAGKNKTEVLYISVLSKELDRANRHFLSSIQTLKNVRQPQMNVTVQTNTAVIGQQQMIQTQNYE